MSGITEETSNHLLGNTAWTNNFCWCRFILKYPNSGLLFTFGLIRIDPCFVPSNDVVDQIWPTSVEFLEHFFAPFNTSLLFWASVKLCGIQRLQSFRTLKWSCKIVCIAFMSMPKNAWISRYVIRVCQSRSIISRTASTLVATTDVDGRPSWNSSLRKVHPRWNSTNQL